MMSGDYHIQANRIELSHSAQRVSYSTHDYSGNLCDTLSQGEDQLS